MSKKLLELIRSILRKTVLPIRKKKEEWLSKFRLSMAFRISVSYLRLLILYGILLMFCLFFFYMYTEKETYDRMADKVIKAYVNKGTSGIINPYYINGISVKIIDKDSKIELYNDIVKEANADMEFLYGIHFDRKSQNNILVIDEDKTFTAQGSKYIAEFQYDLTGSYRKFFDLLWKIMLIYLIVVALIIRSGKRSDVKLFEPLRIMSATANRLTVNNLDSERLNIEGTKNELKDLANVINAMLDRLETSYESQKQFVSDASHELRTPIAVVQGYANLLSRWGTTNEEVLHESIEAIQNEARSMQDLVEKLLFLSRHDMKTLKLNKKRFNMRLVVEDMIKETKLVATKRVINNTIMEDVMVYGDKQSLKQAIRIFIENAIKYSHDGDEITIQCQKNNEECVITVQDSGIGMKKKDIDHIFDRFYRSDYVRNQNISGHGLGLALAKLIILAHTGRIKVRSQFKAGTSFIITIPKRKY